MAANVSDHLEAIRNAYHAGELDEGDRLIDELLAYSDEFDHEAAVWQASSAAAVAQFMDAHAHLSSARRSLGNIRLTKA